MTSKSKIQHHEPKSSAEKAATAAAAKAASAALTDEQRAARKLALAGIDTQDFDPTLPQYAAGS